MAESTTRSGTKAHERSVQISVQDLAAFLREHLGPRLLALTVGVDARTTQRWADGKNTPQNDEFERRMRTAYQVFDLLKSEEASATIRAWFMGMNPQLDDLSPAEALAQDNHREVLSAARAFLAGG